MRIRCGRSSRSKSAKLTEETGLRAGSMVHLGHLYEAYGFSTQGFDVYLAAELAEGLPHRETSEQDMIHRAFSDAEISELIRTGQMVDAPSLAALTLYRLPAA